MIEFREIFQLRPFIPTPGYLGIFQIPRLFQPPSMSHQRAYFVTFVLPLFTRYHVLCDFVLTVIKLVHKKYL